MNPKDLLDKVQSHLKDRQDLVDLLNAAIVDLQAQSVVVNSEIQDKNRAAQAAQETVRSLINDLSKNGLTKDKLEALDVARIAMEASQNDPELAALIQECSDVETPMNDLTDALNSL
jgi:hypothetical protein